MKKISSLATLLFVSILSSCTTYAPVEYRTIGELSAPKNSTIKIVDKENKTLIIPLKNEIVADGWWKYVNEGKAEYEIDILEINSKTVERYSSIDDSKETPVRDAGFRADGTANVKINKKADRNFNKTFMVTASGTADSKRDLPKKHGKMSLWPIFHAVLNYDPREDAIKAQNSFLEMDAEADMDKKLAKAIVNKLTPEKKFVEVELEDGHEDMKSMKEHLKAAEINMAYNYLQQLPNKDARSDVQYNLGVINEMRQSYNEACTYYQNAFNLKPKKLYLKQKTACEVRKLEYLKLLDIK